MPQKPEPYPERREFMDGIFWLIVVVVMAVIEIITLGLTTIWFAGGALASFAASLLGANLLVYNIHI